MKKHGTLFTLCLVACLWLCAAFTCRTGQNQRRESSEEPSGKRTSVDRTGQGKPYGSRDPRACGDLSGAAPSERLAKESFVCNNEKVFGSNLYLIDDGAVDLQLGSPRPYDSRNDAADVSNIDATVPVYPIRGSFRQYQCSQISDYKQNAGKNCDLREHPEAEGLCYKTSFGDWICKMEDRNAQTVEKEVAPPQ